MADVELTIQLIGTDGRELAWTASLNTTDTYFFLNTNGNVLLIFKKGADTNGGTATIKVKPKYLRHGLSLEDQSFDIAQNKQGVLGPFPQTYFNDTGGKTHFQVDSNPTDLSVTAVEYSHTS